MDDDDDLYGDLGFATDLRTPASPPEQDGLPETGGGLDPSNNSGGAHVTIPGLVSGTNTGLNPGGGNNNESAMTNNNFGGEEEQDVDSPLSLQDGLDEALAADVRSALIGGGLLESFDFEQDQPDDQNNNANQNVGNQSEQGNKGRSSAKRSSSSKRNSNSQGLGTSSGNVAVAATNPAQRPSSSSSHAPTDPRDPRVHDPRALDPRALDSRASSSKKRSASNAELPAADAHRDDIKRTRTASASASRKSRGRSTARLSQSQQHNAQNATNAASGGVNFDFDGEGEEGNEGVNNAMNIERNADSNENDVDSVAVEPSVEPVDTAAVEEDALPDAEGMEFDKLREFEARYAENGGNEGEIPLEVVEGLETYVDFAADGVKEEELAHVRPGYRSDRFVLGEMQSSHEFRHINSRGFNQRRPYKGVPEWAQVKKREYEQLAQDIRLAPPGPIPRPTNDNGRPSEKNCCIVARLLNWTSETFIRSKFNSIGHIRYLRFLEHPRTGMSTGVCVVEFTSPESVEKALTSAMSLKQKTSKADPLIARISSFETYQMMADEGPYGIPWLHGGPISITLRKALEFRCFRKEITVQDQQTMEQQRLQASNYMLAKERANEQGKGNMMRGGQGNAGGGWGKGGYGMNSQRPGMNAQNNRWGAPTQIAGERSNLNTNPNSSNVGGGSVPGGAQLNTIATGGAGEKSRWGDRAPREPVNISSDLKNLVNLQQSSAPTGDNNAVNSSNTNNNTAAAGSGAGDGAGVGGGTSGKHSTSRGRSKSARGDRSKSGDDRSKSGSKSGGRNKNVNTSDDRSKPASPSKKKSSVPWQPPSVTAKSDSNPPAASAQSGNPPTTSAWGQPVVQAETSAKPAEVKRDAWGAAASDTKKKSDPWGAAASSGASSATSNPPSSNVVLKRRADTDHSRGKDYDQSRRGGSGKDYGGRGGSRDYDHSARDYDRRGGGRDWDGRRDYDDGRRGGYGKGSGKGGKSGGGYENQLADLRNMVNKKPKGY